MTGSVSMSSVRNRTSIESPSVSTSRSNEPSGCAESRTVLHSPDPLFTSRYWASTRIDADSPRTVRARSGRALPRGWTFEAIAGSTMVRAGHWTSANGVASRRSAIRAVSGERRTMTAKMVAASPADAAARRAGRMSTMRRSTRSTAEDARWTTSSAKCPVTGSVGASASARSVPAARMPRASPWPRSIRSATSTSGGANRIAGSTRITNHATPPPRRSSSSMTRTAGGSRRTLSSTAAATTAARPNANACARRSTSSARRMLARVARSRSSIALPLEPSGMGRSVVIR